MCKTIYQRELLEMFRSNGWINTFSGGEEEAMKRAAESENFVREAVEDGLFG